MTFNFETEAKTLRLKTKRPKAEVAVEAAVVRWRTKLKFWSQGQSGLKHFACKTNKKF